ncbi:MAG: hypothetical protein M1587_10300 [Thaumarchaeota archaeon]|nr:hypothetical protein [Nitrososphaerota archaeon]MDG6908183.1 hypothetical protein [Nitrososphaerota archaeon]
MISTSLEEKRRLSIWGKSLVVTGAILILIGAVYILFVPIVQQCPAGGCPTLTSSQILGFYLPALVLVVIGIAFEGVGVRFIMKSRSIKLTDRLDCSVDGLGATH